MKVLDLFCGPGGSAFGMSELGYEVFGIDIKKQEYPFDYAICDVFSLPLEFFNEFDFIWSSPPCQGYVDGNMNKPGYNRLIPRLRYLLNQTKKPYVIENVQLAPLRHDLMLCGDMFNLKVIRHRFFEINGFYVPRIKHKKHKGKVATGDYIACYNGGAANDRTRAKYGIIKVTPEEQAKALGITWTTKNITESIPPAYSKYILEHLKEND